MRYYEQTKQTLVLFSMNVRSRRLFTRDWLAHGRFLLQAERASTPPLQLQPVRTPSPSKKTELNNAVRTRVLFFKYVIALSDYSSHDPEHRSTPPSDHWHSYNRYKELKLFIYSIIYLSIYLVHSLQPELAKQHLFTEIEITISFYHRSIYFIEIGVYVFNN